LAAALRPAKNSRRKKKGEKKEREKKGKRKRKKRERKRVCYKNIKNKKTLKKNWAKNLERTNRRGEAEPAKNRVFKGKIFEKSQKNFWSTVGLGDVPGFLSTVGRGIVPGFLGGGVVLSQISEY